MTSVTTPASVVPSPSTDDPSRSIPSLDELRAWTSEPDHRVVIQGVDWAFYEQLVDSIPEGANIHVDYDGKDVEIMALSALHDGEKKLFGQLVEAIAQELEIPYKSGWDDMETAGGRARLGVRRMLLLQSRQTDGGDRGEGAAIEADRRLSQS